MKLTLIYCCHLILRSRCFDGCSNNIPCGILSVFLSLGTCFFLIYIIMCTYVLSFNLTTNSFSSVQFSRSVVSDSLQPQGPQHARPPCPSPTTRVYPNSCPLSWWCHPTILSSVIPFSSCLQSFPESQSFPKSALRIRWPKYWSSASTSILPMNTQDWSPLGWTGWISLQSKGLSRVFSNTTVQKHQFFGAQLSL